MCVRKYIYVCLYMYTYVFPQKSFSLHYETSVNKNDYVVKVNGDVVEMPPKELELLFFLASNPNKVYTRAELLKNVWKFEYYGDSRTVDVHVKRLREKINVENVNWSLETVWSVGYKFEVR